MGSLDNCFGFNWGMDVKNGSEGGGKLICKVGCIGSWLCVERGSENVTFEVVNINGIVGAVYSKLYKILFSMWFKQLCSI